MRPRKQQRNLPPCVYSKHGAYWYVKKGRWTRLGTDLRPSPEKYASLHTAPKGEMPDLTEPVVISTGRAGGKTIDCLCNHLHKDLLRDFNYAMVWGLSPKHQPQRVGLSHVLMDEDVVQVCVAAGLAGCGVRVDGCD